MLEVHQARNGEILKDLVRVSEKKRISRTGNKIKANSVCKISSPSTGGSVFAVLRGLEQFGEENFIRMDEYLREDLCIEFGERYEFVFETKWWYRFVWPWGATDPGYKISSKIALISLGLGIISVILGLIAIYWDTESDLRSGFRAEKSPPTAQRGESLK